MISEKFFVRRDLALRTLPAQIGNLPHQAGIAVARQIRRVLIPGDGILEIFLLFVQCSQPSREIDALRLAPDAAR